MAIPKFLFATANLLIAVLAIAILSILNGRIVLQSFFGIILLVFIACIFFLQKQLLRKHPMTFVMLVYLVTAFSVIFIYLN